MRLNLCNRTVQVSEFVLFIGPSTNRLKVEYLSYRHFCMGSVPNSFLSYNDSMALISARFVLKNGTGPRSVTTLGAEHKSIEKRVSQISSFLYGKCAKLIFFL